MNYTAPCALALCIMLHASPCFSEIVPQADENSGAMSIASTFVRLPYRIYAMEGEQLPGEVSFFRKTTPDEYIFRIKGPDALMNACMDSAAESYIIMDSTIYGLPFLGYTNTAAPQGPLMITGYADYLVAGDAKTSLMRAKSVWIELRPKQAAPIQWKVLPEMLDEWREVILKNNASA